VHLTYTTIFTNQINCSKLFFFFGNIGKIFSFTFREKILLLNPASSSGFLVDSFLRYYLKIPCNDTTEECYEEIENFGPFALLITLSAGVIYLGIYLFATRV